MKKFGYLNEDNGLSSALYTEQGISNIIKSVQKFGDIPQTGLVDNATLKVPKALPFIPFYDTWYCSN